MASDGEHAGMRGASRSRGAGRARGLVVPLAVVATVLSVAPANAAPGDRPASPDRRVIVQLAGAPALAGAVAAAVRSGDPGARTAAWSQARARQVALRAAHRDFVRDASAAHLRATVRARYTNVFNGLALRLPANQVPALAHLPGVVSVHPDAAVHQVAVRADVAGSGARRAWDDTGPSGRRGDGTGQVVAVVDTGVDYTHPDLGGGFGPGHKVVAGYDLVNGDADPMDDNGHGTHVAGIVAGDPSGDGGRTGVAPHATLTAYKVLDRFGHGLESTVIAGLDAAVDPANPHRAGTVNLSLSGPAGADDPLDAACEQAVRAGVVVVAAAGNDGPGESTVGSPAEAPDVLAVGASVTGVDLPEVSVVSPVRTALHADRLGLSANPPAGGETLDVVDAGNGLDYTGIDADGRALLISYPPVFQMQRVLDLAADHHAAAVILHTARFFSPFDPPAGDPAAVLAGPDVPSAEAARQPRVTPGRATVVGAPGATAGTQDGRLPYVAAVINGSEAGDIADLLAAGPVRISVRGTPATDLVASFSAHGPAAGSYRLKPDLVAPGVEIRSTWLGGGYARDSGTSMAAPQVAGAAALVRRAHPDWSATQVAAALTGAARRLPGYDAVTQGSGRLDVTAATGATVLAAPRTANLGLADLGTSTMSATARITLSNVDSSPVTVAVAVGPAPARPGQPDATVTVRPDRVTIPAGQRTSVTLSLTAPRTSGYADLDGWVRATPDHGPAVSVPYLLAARPLLVHASPDPTTSGSEVFVHSEAALGAAPEVTVVGPRHTAASYRTTFDHPGWWRVPVPADIPGSYQVRAAGATPEGTALVGTGSFEVTAPPHGRGRAGWQPVGPMGDAGLLATTPDDPARIYALSAFGRHPGVFRSDDHGTSWHELRSLDSGDGADIGIAADPRDADTVYVTLNGGSFDQTYQGRLVVSHDAGRTWTRLPFPDVGTVVGGLSFDGRVLTVTTGGAAYLSADRGVTWQPVWSPDGFLSSARLVGPDLYLVTDGGLYVVHDAVTRPSAPALVFQSGSLTDPVADVVGDGDLVVARTLHRVVVSHDRGATWREAFTTGTGEGFLSSLTLADHTVYVASSHRIWVGSHDGASWAAMPAPLDSGHFAVYRTPGRSAATLVSVLGVGLYRTTDQGASYRRIGITGTLVNDVAVTTRSGHDVLVAGGEFGVHATPLPDHRKVTPSSLDWGLNGSERVFGARVARLVTSPRDPGTLYRLTTTAQSRLDMERSTDGGLTWTSILGTRIDTTVGDFIVDPADPRRLYLAYVGAVPGLLVSRDAGRSWREADWPHRFDAVVGDPRDPDRIWLGGPDGLFRSDDAGQTLVRLQATPVSALALDPARPGHLIVGGDGLYTSPDGGRTLVAARHTTVPTRITELVVTGHGRWYAATGAFLDGARLPVGGRGVLESTDHGASWHNISRGLGNLDVSSLVLSPDGRWLFAGTVGGGVYRLGT